MFNYNPTVNDNSGQITAGYQTKSAEIKAAGNEALAKGIMDGATSAIGGIAGAYQQSRMQAAGGKAFKDFMGVAGPSMGLKDEQLKMFKGMNDQDAYQMSQMFMPVAPSMISSAGLGNYQNRLALQSQQNAYQNQVPANQQPVSLSTQNDAATQQGGAQNWMDLVPNRK